MGAQDLVKAIKEKKGANAASLGTEYEQVPRIPTGFFELDLAIGGGMPEGKTAIIYGHESSNKTNTFYSTVRFNQGREKYQGFFFVLVDLENSHDSTWAKRMGVDLSRLVVTRPDTAEEAIDQVQAFMDARDVALVCIDSIAALINSKELEGAGDRDQVGGSSIRVQTMLKKCNAIQSARRKEGLPPTLLLINQIRHKIGVMFGNPETFSGGNYQKFASSLTLRYYGKDIKEKDKDDLPYAKETTVGVKKNKVPLVSQKAVFSMRLLAGEGPGELVGRSNDWNTLVKYMKLHGLLSKAKKGSGWEAFGAKFANLDEVRETVYSDPDNEWLVKQETIKAALIAAHGPEVMGEDEKDFYETPMESSVDGE